MKTRIMTFLAVILAVNASLVWAGDPWTEKPSNAWSKKDVEKILTKSPWARKVSLDLTGVLEKRTVYVDPGSSTRPQDVRPIISREGGIVGYETNAPTVEARTFKIPCLVQWISARTLREAVVRSSVLQGMLTEGEAKRYSALTSDNYEVSVQGSSMLLTALGPDRETWAQAATLRLKSNKREIEATDYSVQAQGDVAEIRFFFPRMREGNPGIPPGEQKVDFRLASESETLNVTFDLRKMVRDGEPDL
jgi:hypothetical protein